MHNVGEHTVLTYMVNCMSFLAFKLIQIVGVCVYIVHSTYESYFQKSEHVYMYSTPVRLIRLIVSLRVEKNIQKKQPIHELWSTGKENVN